MNQPEGIKMRKTLIDFLNYIDGYDLNNRSKEWKAKTVDRYMQEQKQQKCTCVIGIFDSQITYICPKCDKNGIGYYPKNSL